MRVVITGANRGIGLAMTKVHLERGDTVEATARRPEEARELATLAKAHATLTVRALDVLDARSIEAWARAVAEQPIDRLVNNAGIASPWEDLAGFDKDTALRVYETNAIAPVLVVRALQSALERGKGRIAFHISSRMGSIGDNSSGGSYGYRMSKAALNMASKSLALDLAGKLGSVVLHPGWVQTDMGGAGAPLTVGESASRLVALMDRLGMSASGQFYSYDGTVLPW